MKAVIPVAGAGTHLRPYTHTQPKPLIPVAGEPILGHIIRNLQKAGIHEFLFVIGYLGEKIKNYVTLTFGNSITYDFVVQEPRKGLAHAISLCKPFLKTDEEIIISLGDIIVDVDMVSFLSGNENRISLHVVANPSDFGIAAVDDAWNVLHLTEKPKIPKSNLAMVGLYKIVDIECLFECIHELLSESHKDEYYLTDALANMLSKGKRIRGYQVNNWYDCGKKDALLQSNRLLMQGQEVCLQNQCEQSVVIPPVNIHPSAKIKHSIIGPYVTVGENTLIERSVIQDVIVGSYAHLESIILKNSIVGNDATLIGRSQSIHIGDNTEINFND